MSSNAQQLIDMVNPRTISALLTWLAVTGIIGGTLGFGIYVRSDTYRKDVEQKLATFFGMPVDVGYITPHSFYARQLRDVKVYLPQRRAIVFDGPRVLWDAGGPEGTATLHVHDSHWVIDSTAWEAEDYMRVLRASLAKNLRILNISQVRFHNSDFRWRRNGFTLEAPNVDGALVLDEAGRGKASLTCHRINDVVVNEPVQIFARVDPHQDVFLPEVSLIVPSIPLADLRLDEPLGSRVTQGRFSGRVTLRQQNGSDEIELSGLAADLRLEEFTSMLPTGPISALVNMTIEHALVRDQVVEYIALDGRLDDLDPEPIARYLNWPPIGGRLHLRVHEAIVNCGRLDYLSTSGNWMDGSLPALTEAILDGRPIQGTIQARLQSLIIENQLPSSGQLHVTVAPPPDEPAYIDRELLIDVLEQRLGVRLPKFLLGKRVAYTHMGANVLLNPSELRLLGTDGPAGRAMLTIRAYGREIPLLGGAGLTFRTQEVLEHLTGRFAEFQNSLENQFRQGTTDTRLAE